MSRRGVIWISSAVLAVGLGAATVLAVTSHDAEGTQPGAAGATTPATTIAPTTTVATKRTHVRPADNRPNILLIVTDDQRIGSMSSLPTTRRIFKRGGVTYTEAYDTTPLCCPSRSSIFTGLYAHNHHVTRNDQSDRLPLRHTIQHYLHAGGYQTAIDGKYLGWGLKDPAYWDRWTVLRPPGYYKVRFNVDGQLRTIRRYSTDFIASKALEYLDYFEKKDTDPWFLYVTPNAPHPPAVPEPAYKDARVPPFPNSQGFREKDRSDKPPYVQDTSINPERSRDFYKRQLRSLMSVDDLVGGIFDKMETLDEDRKTLAIFISDNGYMWGEHGLLNKRLPYTESIKAPMFARWPGHLPKGAKVDRLVANIDLAPTLVKAARVGPVKQMDGRSLFGPHVRDRMLTEYFRDVNTKKIPTWASLRTKRYQYIEYFNHAGETTFREYYNLRKDPHQLRNVLNDGVKGNEPNTRELHRRLMHDKRCKGTNCP
ncbi:MAG: hypothetical protein QOK47_1595 [Actinomycetota bacterium]|nr:hypothetical protein [Actinomycetota bacterium]